MMMSGVDHLYRYSENMTQMKNTHVYCGRASHTELKQNSTGIYI